MADKEEFFKTIYYKNYDSNLSKKYKYNKEGIIGNIQEDCKIRKHEIKQTFKEDLAKFTYQSVLSKNYDIGNDLKKMHENYKKESLELFDGEFSVKSHKNGNLRLEVRQKTPNFTKTPNFATAKFSYVIKDKLYVEDIILPIKPDFDSDENHSERRIFREIKTKLKENTKMVLDIHTKLSMCAKCFDNAKELVNNHKSLTIRISFDQEYYDYYRQKKEIENMNLPIIRLIQQHIEFVDNWPSLISYEDGEIIGSAKAGNDRSFDESNFEMRCHMDAHNYITELLGKIDLY